MKKQKEYKMIDIVESVIGDIMPVGESHYDQKVIKSIEQLKSVADDILMKLSSVAKMKNHHAYSIKRAGDEAYVAMLCLLENFEDVIEEEKEKNLDCSIPQVTSGVRSEYVLEIFDNCDKENRHKVLWNQKTGAVKNEPDGDWMFPENLLSSNNLNNEMTE
jgi:hypothetical protein